MYIRVMPVGYAGGTLPAPASKTQDTLCASLLGSPPGGNPIIFYTRGQHLDAIPLSGKPLLVRFAVTGNQCVTVWMGEHETGSHATLVNAVTGRVRDPGPALAAFWVNELPA